MTPEEKQSLVDLKGTPGLNVLEYLIKLKIDELKDVTNIDLKSQVGIGIQTLAHQKAVKILQEFLSELGFKQTKKESNTYE